MDGKYDAECFMSIVRKCTNVVSIKLVEVPDEATFYDLR